MRRFTHLIFDLGDTLVDLRGLIPAMAHELEKRFPELHNQAQSVALSWVVGTAEGTARARGSFYRPGLAIAGEALTVSLSVQRVALELESAIELVKSAWNLYLRRPKLHDDVSVEFLQSLRSAIEGIGLVTDSDEVMVKPLLHVLDLERAFDVIVISDGVLAYKPDPSIYQAALSKMRARPATSAFVSDSVVDLEGALSLGMGAVWINRRGARESLAPPGTYVLDDLRLLPEVVAGLR